MQFSQTKPARGIVYDSNFGETIDTVLALALLHGFEGKSKARVACLSISKANLKSAQLCDVVEKFYASATTGLAALFMTGLPIGLASGASPDSPILTATLDHMDGEGKPVYTPRIQKLNDTAVPEVLMRNSLLAQYDGNCSVVLAGPATNLARLLALRGAEDLIASKVKMLVMTEESLDADAAAAKSVIASWPSPIVLVDREVSTQLLYPGASIEKDFGYTTAHPVADAYRAAHPAPSTLRAPQWQRCSTRSSRTRATSSFQQANPSTFWSTRTARTKSLRPMSRWQAPSPSREATAA